MAADSNKQFRVPLDKAVKVGSIMQSHLVVVWCWGDTYAVRQFSVMHLKLERVWPWPNCFIWLKKRLVHKTVLTGDLANLYPLVWFSVSAAECNVMRNVFGFQSFPRDFWSAQWKPQAKKKLIIVFLLEKVFYWYRTVTRSTLKSDGLPISRHSNNDRLWCNIKIGTVIISVLTQFQLFEFRFWLCVKKVA